MGSLKGQLNILKVTESDVSRVLTVDFKEKILAVHTSQSLTSTLRVTILTNNALIKHEMQSDTGIYS